MCWPSTYSILGLFLCRISLVTYWNIFCVFKWHTRVLLGTSAILFPEINLHLNAAFCISNVTGLFCMYSYMAATGVVLTARVTILSATFCDTSN